MNPYEKLVRESAKLLKDGASYPLGGFAPAQELDPKNAPKVLIFSPHPDDECIVGALPLRLLREARMNVINVAVTLGSNKARRKERIGELQGACGHVGFRLILAAEDGLESISPESREAKKKEWARAVKAVAKFISSQKPRAIFLPHRTDWHPTHIGTHLLVMDALKELKKIECFVVETEYWGAMETPNLMVESSVAEVTDLVTALSFHAGEVRRNPFHLRLPAWMQDNVRRGSELIAGKGEAAPDFAFATLYRLRRWRAGKLEKVRGGFIGADQNAGELFRPAG